MQQMIAKSLHNFIDFQKERSFDIDGVVFAVDHRGAVFVHRHIGNGLTLVDDFFAQNSFSDEAIGNNAVSLSMKTLTVETVAAGEHTLAAWQSYHSLALPIFSKTKHHIATLGMLVTEEAEMAISLTVLKSIAFAMETMLSVNYPDNNAREFEIRQILFQTVKTLHSQIHVDSVLVEAVDSLTLIFPHVQLDLYLSQDNQSSNLPVKPLMLDDTDHDLSTQAFMTGQMQMGHGAEGETLIAAPLSGKQGVYGVFHLTFQAGQYDDSELEYIEVITDAAGAAFENAKLYEQSNLLISELRLINEITRRLNQSLKLQDIFTYASNELLKIFDGNYGCILKLDRANDRFIVEATNLPSFTNEVISLDYGFSGIVYKTKEPLIISDYLADSKVESKLMKQTDSRSLIATPIIVNSEVVGAIFVTHREPNFFTYEDYKLLQVISVHIGLAIANASLHAELRRMVITDNLTGLFTRSYLDEQVAMMQKRDYCGALIMVDIDYFKDINDTYGHQVGDRVLIQIGNIVKKNIRDTDIAARWGGEELAIYLPLARLEQTQKIADRIRQCIVNETDPQVTVSCGIALWNWEDETISVESLFYRADMALYKAKNEGRNRTIIG